MTVPAQKKETAEDGTETDVPSVVILGPYYRPESLRNEIKTETDGNNNDKEVIYPHVYRLTLGLQDQFGEGPEFEDVAIGHLHALFRNTNVYITVTMSSGDVEVYAEISGWNRYEAYGWVNDGNDDSSYVDPEKQRESSIK